MKRRFAGLVGLVFFASISGVALKALGAPPNVAAIMPFVMAAGLVGGPVFGFLAGLATRGVYDVYLGSVGPWTLLTSPSYGVAGMLVGLAGLWWKKWDRVRLAALAVAVTLVYDAVTMVLFSVPFGFPLWQSVMMQVPFTINHVVGNALFCFLFVPLVMPVLRKLGVEMKAPTAAPAAVL